MKLSESLRRGIMESAVGGVINKFKIRRRRVTLFFEDISANYILACENNGYGKEMREIGRHWGKLASKTLIPAPVQKLPLPLFSKTMNSVWVSLGTLDYFKAARINGALSITVKNDAITRIIGKNNFVEGTFAGIIEAYLNRNLEPLNISQSKESSIYLYKIKNNFDTAEGKDTREYNRLNAFNQNAGVALEGALKNSILRLDGNRIYFRGKSICNSENTIFHIISNKNILLDKVPEIARQYFGELIDADAAADKKLSLLKTILQAMGWGIVKITMKENTSVSIEISGLPCGFQPESDNWAFLANTILGYLQTINAGFMAEKIIFKKRSLSADYVLA